MLKLISHHKFEKDLAKSIKRNKDREKLKAIVALLRKQRNLPTNTRIIS